MRDLGSSHTVIGMNDGMAEADLARISDDLAATFPDLASPKVVRVLGSGFRSLAVTTAGGIVFRIGKNRMAAAGHHREALFLPHFAPLSTVPVPNPRFYAGPSDHFSFGVIGYDILPGAPLAPEHLHAANERKIAENTASFLLALHRFPSDQALELGLPGPEEQTAAWAIIHDEVLPPLRDALTAAEYMTVLRWWDNFMAEQATHSYTPVVQHGDLWYENMLLNDSGSRLSGVLDFENVAIGDPAQDFATLLHLGTDFTGKVIRAYQQGGGTLGNHFAARLQRLWQVRVFDGIQFAIRTADSTEFEDALEKLRGGPILSSNL